MSDVPMKFDAYQLSRVWLSVAIAQGEDAELPVLYRSTLVEWYPTGIRLVSTDGFILIRGWVSAGSADDIDRPEPPIARRPTSVTVVRDLDRRLAGLLGFLRKSTNGQPERKADPIDVVLHAGDRRANPATPTLSDDLAPEVFTVEVPGEERLNLPTFDGAFPSWRQFFTGHVPSHVAQMGFGPSGILRLGALSKFWGAIPLHFTFGGDMRPVQVDLTDPTVAVHAIAMPARLHPDDDDQSDDDDPAPAPTPPAPSSSGRALTMVPPVDHDEVDDDPAGAAERSGKPTRRRKAKVT